MALCAKEYKHAIYVGFGTPNFIFEVKDNNNQSEARMVRNPNVFLSFGYQKTPTAIFQSARFLRWSLEFGISPYRANLQIADRITDLNGTDDNNEGKEVDLGNHIDGYVTYLNPTLDFYFDFNENYYFYLGFGIGLGFARVNGDYYHLDSNADINCKNSTTSADVYANCEKKYVDFNRVAASSNDLFVIGLKNFGIRYERGGPEIKLNEKKYTIHNEMLSLFYQYRF